MKEKSSIVFTGDIGFDHYMEGRYEDSDLLADGVKRFLSGCDHLVVNVEGALSEGEKSVRENSVASLLHSMNPKVALFLKDIGADIWNICNNHIMDAGAKGLSDTLKAASENGAMTIGAGMDIFAAEKPVILDEAGGIGMFGVGYQRACRKASEDTPGCFSWSDMEKIREVISNIKKTCRWCVVVAHGGEEFTSLPSPYTRRRYMDYLSMGADVVVAHHPHVPMNYETFDDGKMIFYSLGNFIFDTDYQRAQFNTEKGLFVRLDFTKSGFSFEPFGIEIDRESERIVEAELPLIFEDVKETDYELLEPLSAKAFIEATKKQLIYLNPGKFKGASDDIWNENFMEENRSGRVPGETLDFRIIVPIAERESEKAWEKSSLEKVKKYILFQLD